MPLYLHPDGDKLLLTDTGKLASGPDCCCDTGCDCCGSGTGITQVTLVIAGMADQNCDDCELINGTYVLALDNYTCIETTVKDCRWTFVRESEYDEWCEDTSANLKWYLEVTLEYNGTTGELEVTIIIWMNPFGGGNTLEQWRWMRSVTVSGGTPFDCVAEANSIDTTGDADLIEYNVSYRWCDKDAPVTAGLTFA